VYLFQMDSVKIIRHVKVRNGLNPFDLAWQDYLRQRQRKMMRANMLLRRSYRQRWLHQGGLCPVCHSILPEHTGDGMNEAGPCSMMDAQLVHRHCLRRWIQQREAKPDA